MFEAVCPQCKKTADGTSKRLVKDTCGHEKCRMCLLLDEEKCQQCNKTELATLPSNDQPSVIKYENHKGVITCNGSIKTENLSNGFKEPKIEIKPAREVPTVKTKRAKVETTKRSYQTIVIPNHIIVLKDPLQYKCNICKKQFTTKAHVKHHVYCTGQPKPLRCDLCSKEFVTKQHLDIHMLKHLQSVPYPCDICHKSFREKSKLKRHSLLHSSLKPYICSECGKAFRSKESLKLHTLIHRGEKPFSCRICSLTFNNTSNLNKHLISHSNEKTHMCDQCGKTFKLKWALTVHRRCHLKEKPFECSTCAKAFVNNKDLQRHQLIHLESKAYVCSICTTSFRRKDNLHRHVKNTHPGKKVDPVSTTVKQLISKPSIKPVDNPNAINVITVSPVCKPKLESKPINRTETVINGPPKLAFKTDKFKNNYNIHRAYNYEPYDFAQSVNICQKILSPHASIIRSGSTEIPQRNLHYETSFEHKQHAIIKNIKFKLPSYYTNLNKTSDIAPLKPTATTEVPINSNANYTELKSVSTGKTSVIVNTSTNNWRKRAS